MCAILLAVGVGWAQEEAAEEPPAEEVAQEEVAAEEPEGPVMEEVIVTARKTEESLDDVPLTMRALTADDVAGLGLVNVDDVALATPGIHISNYFGDRVDPNISFRGMDGGTISRLNQISSAYIDGVYLPGTSRWISVGALQRSEVAKGPQSALYGRTSFGGAVNFVLKPPTPEWGGDLALTAGENGRIDAGASVAGPISDNFRFQAYARGYDYDGGYDNPYPGDTLGSESTRALTGALEWDISQSVALKLRGLYSEDEDGPPAFIFFDSRVHNCGPFEQDGETGSYSYYCGEVSQDLTPNWFGYDTIVEDTPGSNWPKDRLGLDRQFSMGSLDLNAMLSDSVSLTSITAYLNEKVEYMSDFSGSETLIQYSDTEDTLISQELRVQGSTSKLDWMVGFYYLDAEYETIDSGWACSDPGWSLTFAPFPGSGCIIITGAPVRGAYSPIEFTPFRYVDNTALFGTLNWHVSDSLSLAVDARVARETLDYGSVEANDGVIRELKDDFDSFVPRLLVDWKPSDTSTVYASIAWANNPGGFNTEVAAMCTQCQEDFEEEFGIGITVPESEAMNYEAGYKAVSRNGRHRFNAAVFYFDWENQQFRQAEVWDTDGDGMPNFEDSVDYDTVAGESRIVGGELFYSGWLGPYFNLTATYNYNDTEYIVFEDSSYRRVYGSPDASGKEMPRSPKHSGTLGLGFVIPAFGDWDFNARADYIYRGRSYAWAINQAYAGVTNRLNLRAGVSNDRWDFSVWMTNVTDDDTLMAVRRFSELYDFVTPAWWAGMPGVQEAGVTLRFRF
jgi:iron complex outermembrane receptor protein